jgi:hypothetical protein
MAVTSDSTTTRALIINPPNPFTQNITLVDTSTNRQIIVWVLSLDSGAGLPTVSAVTVGVTDSLSNIASISIGGKVKIEGWAGGLTVGAGAKSISVTHNKGGAAIFMAIAAEAAFGTDLVNNPLTASNVDRPINIAMTSSAGDLTTTAFICDGNGAPTTTQTLLGDVTNAITPAGFDGGPGTANPTHQWSDTGLDWANAVMAGANFRAVSAAPATDFGGPSQTLFRVRLRSY